MMQTHYKRLKKNSRWTNEARHLIAIPDRNVTVGEDDHQAYQRKRIAMLKRLIIVPHMILFAFSLP